jgi:hypothetical protein
MCCHVLFLVLRHVLMAIKHLIASGFFFSLFSSPPKLLIDLLCFLYFYICPFSFSFFFFLKSFISFKFSYLTSISHILLFLIWSIFFLFLIFFLSFLIKNLLVFNFTLQSKFIVCYSFNLFLTFFYWICFNLPSSNINF